MQNFIARNRNTEFSCAACGKPNPPHPTSCRNHCRSCLASRHVDAETPGDRKSQCRALMPAVGVTLEHGEEILTHRCEDCSKTQRNVVAPDDDRTALEQLSSDVA